MRNKFLQFSILLFAVCMFVFGACSREERGESVSDSIELTFYTVGGEESKTTYNDVTGSIIWNASEKVNIFFGDKASGSLISQNEQPSGQVIFKGSLSPAVDINDTTDYFWAVYPYDASNSCDGESVTITVPSVQVAAENTFADKLFPSLAKTKTDRLYFQNICGGARLKVYNSGIKKVIFASAGHEPLSGKVKVSLSESGPVVENVISGSDNITIMAPDDGEFVPGVYYYITALPVSMAKGFDMLFIKDKSLGTYRVDKQITISRSLFGNLVELDKGIEFKELINLSESETANSYVVSAPGLYCFNAGVKGGSTEPLDGTPASAEVLWESFGTDVTPSVGDIVSSAELSAGFVCFTTPSTLNNGNAVIAVKDASGTILWSWHIWVCDGYDPLATAQVYKNDAGTMMDRNLGAVSATRGSAGSAGLLYQWGRKDPFLGSNGRDVLAVSTISWPASVASDANCGTIDYASAHPTTFITENSENKDWYYTGSSSTDDTRWKTPDLEKGMYDPCPAGWRVPDGGNTGTWSKAFGSSYNISSGPWDDTNKGMDFGSGNGKSSSMQLGSSTEIWYPAPGYRRGDDVTSMCEYGYYWSSTTTAGSAYRIGVTYKGIVNPSNYSNRSYAQSVRCKKQ